MARDTYIQKVVLNEGQNNLNLLVPLTRQPHRKEDAILVSHSFYFILFIMLPIVCCRKENQNLQQKDHLIIIRIIRGLSQKLEPESQLLTFPTVGMVLSWADLVSRRHAPPLSVSGSGFRPVGTR